MTDQAMPHSDLVERIDALYAKATQGPYFVRGDDARDTLSHADSGLAQIDTGRFSDWPVLRLGEWPTTRFIAELANAWPEIRERLKAGTRAAVIEEAARVAEGVRNGYSAAIRTDASEQEFMRDPDGPWVLNSDVAAAIRALAAEGTKGG